MQGSVVMQDECPIQELEGSGSSENVPREGLGLCLVLLEAIILPCDFLAPASLLTHGRLICSAAQKHPTPPPHPPQFPSHQNEAERCTGQNERAAAALLATDPPCWEEWVLGSMGPRHSWEESSIFLTLQSQYYIPTLPPTPPGRSV